jgi:hypothetical protein
MLAGLEVQSVFDTEALFVLLASLAGHFLLKTEHAAFCGGKNACERKVQSARPGSERRTVKLRPPPVEASAIMPTLCGFGC